MENVSRVPSTEQIHQTEKLLAERKNWLEEEFIPQLQKQFPELEQFNVKAKIEYLTEEELKDFKEDELLYNEPLTVFEITLGKIIDLPDPETETKIREFRKKRIWQNELEEECRKHQHADGIKWTQEVLEKTKEINARTTELLTELYEKSKIIRNILNKEYEKGNKLFADFEITGQIVFTNHKLKLYPENENPALANLLCEMANHHSSSHETLLYWNDQHEMDLEEVLFLDKELKNWNIEVFKNVPDEISVNYYMHCLFCDGNTYNLYDMMNMKPQDFQAQITIRTWDYLPEREDG